ncbi:uncharacterized protein [Nothobranchius furzeri]|uniref:Transmembrane protein n=1 Tax=Nothobranchius furzeri TaxID=105023 RepID=A0A8C6NWP5_NOTFU
MKPQSWMRRKWLWVAGGAFVTIHLTTWILQKAVKSSTRSEMELKYKTLQERTN